MRACWRGSVGGGSVGAGVSGTLTVVLELSAPTAVDDGEAMRLAIDEGVVVDTVSTLAGEAHPSWLGQLHGPAPMASVDLPFEA